MNPVYTIFNDIAMGMVHAEDGEEYISNVVHLKGASGEVHTLSINQVQLLLGILAGEHPFLTSYNPLEFLLFSYQFQDIRNTSPVRLSQLNNSRNISRT